MDTGRLHQMVEQIARNFAVRGEDLAVAATVDHIRAFWDPRMKAALIGGSGEGLSPIARRAIDQIAAGRTPPSHTGATGHSDAG
jgi:formate dehydrogenase subunit delta